ncbi:hypothetical protein [Legionella spiritensis]|uniref:hypothetical protein n=1 Tax=Legionella spiritensis TaxID=452 RepID=UPI000F718EEA|nr:hypothetical protein [Legionella spiritensis]VEG91812.1 Predicted membrane protein [Legionella spiritensis]
MMMGLGVFILFQARLKEGWSSTAIVHYLTLRGILLILLQLTLLHLFEWFAMGEIYFYAGVLLSLGLCMIAAGLCLQWIHRHNQQTWGYFLPLALTFAIPLLLQWWWTQNPTSSSLWRILLITGGASHQPFPMDINFTPIPWFPAVAFGLFLGNLWQASGEKVFKRFGQLALLLFITWFALRTLNLIGWCAFGDYKSPTAGETVHWASYFSMSKFPPSIDYFLWSFAINLIGLCLWQQSLRRWPQLVLYVSPLKTFGQSALFFFILHWFVYYGLSLLITTRANTALTMAGFWMLGLAILYPLCKQYRIFKRTKSRHSIWRMF